MNAGAFGCHHDDVVDLVLFVGRVDRGEALGVRVLARDVERTLARLLVRRRRAIVAEALILRPGSAGEAVDALRRGGLTLFRCHPAIARVDLTALLEAA